MSRPGGRISVNRRWRAAEPGADRRGSASQNPLRNGPRIVLPGVFPRLRDAVPGDLTLVLDMGPLRRAAEVPRPVASKTALSTCGFRFWARLAIGVDELARAGGTGGQCKGAEGSDSCE